MADTQRDEKALLRPDVQEDPPIDQFDFLDFGASNGGSIAWASGALGGRGFGIDIDPKKIEKLRSKGFHGKLVDANEFTIAENSVEYSTMINFLEHLPGRKEAAKVIANAYSAARKFAFILGPDFESLPYLREAGFKKYYADWSGHTWHHRTHELAAIASEVGAKKFVLVQYGQIFDSWDRTILPLNAARNRGNYDPAIDPPKPFKVFEGKIYGTLAAILVKDTSVSIDRILLRTMGLHMNSGKEELSAPISR